MIPHLRASPFQGAPMTRGDKISMSSPTIGHFQAHHHCKSVRGSSRARSATHCKAAGPFSALRAPSSIKVVFGALRRTAHHVRSVTKTCLLIGIALISRSATMCTWQRTGPIYCSPNRHLSRRCSERQQNPLSTAGRAAEAVEFCGGSF